MFPVDASIVERMNGYGRRTLDMIAELNDYGVASRRLMPSLVWSVQSFNMYNLENSRMTAGMLLGDLKNTSRKEASASSAGAAVKSIAASAVLGSRAAEASNTFVLDGLFRSTNLVPVRRPHADDKIVANLARYPSDILSTDYLHDVAALRELSLREILPAHRCRLQNKTTIPLFPKRCGIAPWTGPELVSALEVWVKYGHVVDPSETDEALNETAAMEDFQTEHDLWVQRECTRLADLLRARLKAGWAEVAPSNLTGVKLVADESMKSVLKFIRSLPRKAMARGVESGTFWQYPGKVATYI